MKPIAALLFALVIAATFARAESNDPAAVTKAAYDTAMAHFGFSPDTVKHEKAFFTPDLYAALLKKANQPVAKGDAPDIEGDVLLDSQDVPEHFTVGQTFVDGPTFKDAKTAFVHVNLSWGKEKRRYGVSLVQIDGAWKIADVYYGKDGKLTDLLK